MSLLGWLSLMTVWCLLFAMPTELLGDEADARAADFENARPPHDEKELRYWLQNMIWHHRYTDAEIRAATGLTQDELNAARDRLGIRAENRPPLSDDEPLRVLPFPGGRHPRIGFLEGAIRPQRETKVSVFLPWAPEDYVVVDVPEAIWSNLGLTYLAHTHIDTIWTRQNVTLEQLEWNRRQDGTLDIRRTLPNGIAFAARVVPRRDGVKMKLTLTNGTPAPLTDLRVQNCVMLKNADEFRQQTNANKVTREPYTACHSPSGDRWVITAWSPCQRAWANERCPCLHSDPQFPDCGPGETVSVYGWLSFFEGREIESEFDRLETLKWSQPW